MLDGSSNARRLLLVLDLLRHLQEITPAYCQIMKLSWRVKYDRWGVTGKYLIVYDAFGAINNDHPSPFVLRGIRHVATVGTVCERVFGDSIVQFAGLAIFPGRKFLAIRKNISKALTIRAVLETNNS